MRKFAQLVLALLLMPTMALADEDIKPVLDQIDFQIAAKNWVTTSTALLSVSINVTLTNVDLVKARSDIMAKLNKIAKGEWHLLRFDRSQDSSGLEKLYVLAQARVDQSLLTDVYQNARSVSVPGAKYSVNGIEFKPSLKEIQQVRDQLRETLYQQVNAELARINKAYGEQHYTLSQLVFVDGNQPMEPQMLRTKEMKAMMVAAASPAPNLAVSNELTMTALVQVASNRKTGA